MDFTYVNREVLVLAVGMLLFVVVAIAISVANATLRANKNAKQIKLLQCYDKLVIAGRARVYPVHPIRTPFVRRRVDPTTSAGYQPPTKIERSGRAPNFVRKVRRVGVAG